MASMPAVVHVSPEAYLDLERRAETKREYNDGAIVAMTGASRAHNLICLNVGAELRSALRGRPCETNPADMRVKATARQAVGYFYPDVVVVCGEPEFEDAHGDTLLNPTLVVEVLSPPTEVYDRVDEALGRVEVLRILHEPFAAGYLAREGNASEADRVVESEG
jgi:Uma2 family endonuclease